MNTKNAALNTLNIAKTILLAQKIKEESWTPTDRELNGRYGYTHLQAVHQACKENKITKDIKPLIYMLNISCWNDVQQWAESIVRGENPKEVDTKPRYHILEIIYNDIELLYTRSKPMAANDMDTIHLRLQVCIDTQKEGKLNDIMVAYTYSGSNCRLKEYRVILTDYLIANTPTYPHFYPNFISIS